MIDDLATRASLTVAAFLFLATGLSVLGLLDANAVREAAEGLATHLARQLDAISSLDGEAFLRSNDSALDPPPTLAGSPYRIDFLAREIRVVVGATIVARVLLEPIHPHAPGPSGYTADDLALLDTRVLSVPPGEPFVVERTARPVNGIRTYLTFVHLPR